MTSLSIQELGVAYGDTTVFSDVSVEIPSGSWLGLIGPNGAGKSSLLKALLGLLPATGSMLVDGQTVDSRLRAKTIAYLPQRPILPPGMTVAEYVLLGRTAHLSWLSSESERDRLAAADALDRLHLGPFAHRTVADLSGGEAQRVSLARAIAQDAPILLLDEPTSALDLGHQIAVLELVDELRTERELTVIAAMHDLTSAGRFADSLLLLGGGSALASGTPAEVLNEATLAIAYGTKVSLVEAPDGSMIVVPDRVTSRPNVSQPPRPNDSFTNDSLTTD